MKDQCQYRIKFSHTHMLFKAQYRTGWFWHSLPLSDGLESEYWCRRRDTALALIEEHKLKHAAETALIAATPRFETIL